MRKDYVSKLEKYGINYWGERALDWDTKCNVYDDYWTDTGKLEMEQNDENKALKASVEIHTMMLEAVDYVV